MKKTIQTTILFISLFAINSINAQNFSEFSANLILGNFLEISNLLDDEPEVSILNTNTYTKSEAENLLASFFTGKSENEYKAIHKGTAMNDSFYQIGELKTKDETYRTYLYSKKSDGDYRIKEFRIEK